MTAADAERIAGLAALLGTACCTVTLVVLHLLPTGLSPMRDPVSQYGITDYRLGYRVQTVSMGIAAIALAVGIDQLHVQGGAPVVALFAVLGSARLAISWLPMDAPIAPRSGAAPRQPHSHWESSCSQASSAWVR